MGLAEVKEVLAEFEGIMRQAFDQRYAGYPAEIRRTIYRASMVRRWDIGRFVEEYARSGRYPIDRLEVATNYLFDVKLQLYYIQEVDLGLSNLLVYQRGYDAVKPLADPHVLLTRSSLDQNLMGKSRVLWERLMNFVYYLATGETLESKVSGKRSKRKAFFEFLDGEPRQAVRADGPKPLRFGTGR